MFTLCFFLLRLFLLTLCHKSVESKLGHEKHKTLQKLKKLKAIYIVSKQNYFFLQTLSEKLFNLINPKKKTTFTTYFMNASCLSWIPYLCTQTWIHELSQQNKLSESQKVRLYWSAVQCSTVQCSAVQCSAMHYSAV